MFDKPDAPASELTKREVLELVLVHAYLTAPELGPSLRRFDARALAAIDLVVGPPAPPPTPESAEQVVGAITAELEEAAAMAREFERMSDGKTPRAVDAKGGEA